MGYGLPHFLFSNHPLPIHFPFSPILFSLYIPSLHSSFTFIICIIFYLSLPHPLNPFSFAPSLPSIILPLLTILPLFPFPPHPFLSFPLMSSTLPSPSSHIHFSVSQSLLF